MKGGPADQNGRRQPPHQVRAEKKPAPLPQEKAPPVQRTERTAPHKVTRRQQEKGSARRQEFRPYPPVKLRRIEGHVVCNNQDAGNHTGHIHPHHPVRGRPLQNYGSGNLGVRRRHSLAGLELQRGDAELLRQRDAGTLRHNQGSPVRHDDRVFKVGGWLAVRRDDRPAVIQNLD